VSDWDGAAQAQSWRGDRSRSAHGEKKGLIDLAYRVAEPMGIPLWCQDEAGPYQAIPQPGQSWQPDGKPRYQPHEYIRGGTAKLLTLFRPATGEVRARGVSRAPNVVLHPWLQNELLQVLAELPEPPTATQAPASPADWTTWLGHDPHGPLPPLRLLLIWDNLAGHLSTSIVTWLFAHGVMPPEASSWRVAKCVSKARAAGAAVDPLKNVFSSGNVAAAICRSWFRRRVIDAQERSRW